MTVDIFVQQRYCMVSLTHFEQVIKLIKLWGTEFDFLWHHPNLKADFNSHIILHTIVTMELYLLL